MDFGYANNLPVQQSKKDKTNIFTMSVEYSEDKKNVKSILKQQYDDDVDKGNYFHKYDILAKENGDILCFNKKLATFDFKQ